METLHVVKIGGNIVNDEKKLDKFLSTFIQLNSPKILVHGGGSSASDLCQKLDIPIQMINGRRITDEPALDVAVMVYAGLINKKIVARLQGQSCNALGLSGADLNIIPAEKRTGTEIDYGFVGDIHADSINTHFITRLLDEQVIPAISAITHDTKGQLLNTNADTIASTLSVALSDKYEVELTYCFEKNGVLHDEDDEKTLIKTLEYDAFENLKQKKVIHEGMIPKLDTAFEALNKYVQRVQIKHANNLLKDIGTKLSL
ncbi:acetylglutamate kinase [Aliifodinibius salipaludis]|uniref:Acetylglutamate kinase n=1 Tax=Fodinibius salipaludis TaxID=2032627 RepID=A0A2A2G7K8_9BACT|nr:acetylglutamate kinase [Aliifodinibius salipaludis]PAU93601.1 acetylglutamate kinase [Aliifodinibius salipaludis]